MTQLNSILPPDFILTRGEAYKCYLSNPQISTEKLIKSIFFSSPNSPFKDCSTIENNETLSELLNSAIKNASTELTTFITKVKARTIKDRKAIKDRKIIFSIS